MQAILLNQAGGVENLRFQEVEAPRPIPGELLVKVRALSVNPADVKLRSDDNLLTAFLGADRPAFLGWDFAGEVTEVAGAASFQAGDAVFGVMPSSRGRAYAEYVAVPASNVARKPANVGYEAAAVTTMAALTAWNPLVNEARIQSGETVLIHGASGGVGHFAVQIAKHFGATVVATSSAKNREFVLSLGADQHIDYTTRRFEEEINGGVDFVLDTIGGDTLVRSLDAVKDGGRIITLVPFSDDALLERARQRNIALSFGGMRYSAEDLAALADLLGKGELKPHISATYAFGEMAQAHTQLESGRTVGKVVLVLG